VRGLSALRTDLDVVLTEALLDHPLYTVESPRIACIVEVADSSVGHADIRIRADIF